MDGAEGFPVSEIRAGATNVYCQRRTANRPTPEKKTGATYNYLFSLLFFTTPRGRGLASEEMKAGCAGVDPRSKGGPRRDGVRGFGRAARPLWVFFQADMEFVSFVRREIFREAVLE